MLQVAKFNSPQILNRSPHGSITVKIVLGAHNYPTDEVSSNLEVVPCCAPVDLSWNDPYMSKKRPTVVVFHAIPR